MVWKDHFTELKSRRTLITGVVCRNAVITNTALVVVVKILLEFLWRQCQLEANTLPE